MILNGFALNIITPFSDSNEIDFERLDSLLDRQLNLGMDSIVVGRTTGEFFSMSDEEIISVIDFVVKKVAKKVPVIAHIGFNDTLRSVKLAIKARLSGADALILSAPYYVFGNEKGVLNHYRTISMSAKIPCYIENDPERSGIDLSTSILDEISNFENIVGVIERSKNIEKYLDISAKLDLELICGDEKLLIPALACGASGFISEFGNMCPEVIKNIYRMYKDGDIISSRKLYSEYLDLMDVLNIESSPIPIKTAMNMLGFDIGEFRLPLDTMNPDNAARLATLIMDMNINKY